MNAPNSHGDALGVAILLMALIACMCLLAGCSLIEVRTDTSEQRQSTGSASVATVGATVRKRDVVRRTGTDPTTGEQIERITETERTDLREDRQQATQEAQQSTKAATEYTASPAVDSGLDTLLQAALAATGLGGIGAAGWMARALGTARAAVRHVADYADELEQAKNPAEVQQAKAGAKMRMQDRGTHGLVQKIRGKAR